MAFPDPQSEHWEPLLVAAWAAWAMAYAPYSGFQVGAALLAADGSVVAGCNVENAAYPVSLCAERTAVCAAVSRGLRVGELQALVVVTESEVLTPPCGACRQVLAEFVLPDAPVMFPAADGMRTMAFSELMPMAFDMKLK